MAQAITNTVQNPFNSLFSGLVKAPAPKQGYLGGPTKPASPFTSGNTLGQLSTGPTSLVQPRVNPAGVSTGLITPTTQGGNYSATPVKAPVASTVSTQGNALIPTPPAGTAAPTPTAPITSTQPTTQSSTQTGSRGLFPDVLSSLTYGAAAKNAQLGQNAQKIAADAGAEIAQVGGQGARFQAGQLTTGTSPVAEGNAAVTAQTTAAQQQAIAAGANVALTGNAQALTGQSQTQSALQNAGNLAQPSTAAYGQTVFDPTTGTYTGGGGLPPEVMSQYATMAVNGNYSAIPSFITSNPVLNAQLNVAAKALNPNFSPVQASGASGVLGNIPALQSANTAAEGIKNTITSYLQANPTLNPSDLAAGNILQQWIQGKQLTDPKYQTLFNYLNEYTNTLAPILGVGGEPTNLKTQIAQGFINAAASGQSISQVLNAMSQLATNKIQDLQSGATGGGTSVPNTPAPSSGGFAETW